MKIVIMLKNGRVSRIYTDCGDGIEAVELDPSVKEEAVKLPRQGWTDVSLCDVPVTKNVRFVEHVFDDEGRWGEGDGTTGAAMVTAWASAPLHHPARSQLSLTASALPREGCEGRRGGDTPLCRGTARH
jgi:hypothetical protein